MPTWGITVERLDPRDHMNVAADSEAVAIETAIRAFGGLNVVKFVSAELVPTETQEDVLTRLEAEAAEERAEQERRRAERAAATEEPPEG